MADLSITVSNSIVSQGPGEVNLWGTMEWGTDNWGTSQDTWVDIGKWLADSQAISDSVSLDVSKLVSDSQGSTSAIAALYLTDAKGYNFYLKGGDTNAIDRYIPVWVEV